MAANTQPIYSLIPNTSIAKASTVFPIVLLTAANDYTGISASNVIMHTAGVDGSFVDRVVLKALGTNVASLARIYINNGSVNTTATNNMLFAEIPLPATTSSQTTPTQDVVLPLNLRLDPAFRLFIGIETTVAAGWQAVCLAGQFS